MPKIRSLWTESLRALWTSSSCASREQIAQKTLSFSQVQFRGPLRAQCLVRQWIHVLRQFLGAFERPSHIFYVKVEPRILKFISPAVVWSSVHSRCFSWPAGGGCTWKFGHYLHEPLVSGTHFSPSGHFRRGFFGSPRALTAVSRRGLALHS